MAKIELKHLSSDTKADWIKTEAVSIDCDGVFDEISIELNECNVINTIYLDIPTAIKFAKTLRTEINKVKGFQNG